MNQKIINWIGLEAHPTDSYVHWSLKDKEAKQKMIKLRQCWNKIPEECIPELKTLLEAAYETGVDNEAESHAGESL